MTNEPNIDLLTQNAMRDEMDSFHFRVPGNGADDTGFVEPGEVAVGTIRCQSWRTYTMGNRIAILLTNRQTYRETWGILQLQNDWTLVRFNKVGVGKEIKDHGFPVASGDNLWRRVKFPVMKVTVTFPSLKDQKQSDTLVVATIHLRQLMRALWTAKRASEMEVTIHVQTPHTNDPPGERYLLQPFLQLRSIKQLVVLGVSKQDYVDDLTRAITTTDGINQTLGELAAGIKRVQREIKAERWELAVAQAEKNYILMADSKIAYDDLYSVIDPGTSTNTAIARNQVAQEIAIATAIAGAELTLHSGDYASSIHFASRALTHISRAESILQHVTPTDPTVVAHPYHKLPPLTGIIIKPNKIVCDMALLRARAYMGTQQSEPAFHDIDLAGKLMPNSVKVVSASRDWQVLFGAFPVPIRYPYLYGRSVV